MVDRKKSKTHLPWSPDIINALPPLQRTSVINITITMNDNVKNKSGKKVKIFNRQMWYSKKTITALSDRI